MSEPATRPGRRQTARPHCAICGEVAREPIAFDMVRPSLAAGLVAAHPNLTANDVICPAHVAEQRKR